MSGRIAAAIFLSTLCAAQTLRLRYGGPDSVYHVSNVSSGTPAALGSPRQISVDMVITEQLRGGGRSSRARLRGRSLMR